MRSRVLLATYGVAATGVGDAMTTTTPFPSPPRPPGTMITTFVAGGMSLWVGVRLGMLLRLPLGAGIRLEAGVSLGVGVRLGTVLLKARVDVGTTIAVAAQSPDRLRVTS
jgi:hypothetical protein